MLNVKIICHSDPERNTVKVSFVYKDTCFKIEMDVLCCLVKLFTPNSEANNFVENRIKPIFNSKNFTKHTTGWEIISEPTEDCSEINVDKFMDELSLDLSNALEEAFNNGELTHPFWEAININCKEDLNCYKHCSY
jgi:hypothetical protein